MTAFLTHRHNLSEFYYGLKQTDVFILYFPASDLTQPKIRDRFRQWMVNGEPVYVMRGIPDKTMEFNYIYIYTLATTQFLVTPIRNIPDPYDPKEGVIFDVLVGEPPTQSHQQPLVESSTMTAELGNHIDFGIVAHRNPPGTLVKTHTTSYSLEDETMTFSRTYNDCNFLIHSTMRAPPKIGSVRCENPRVKGMPIMAFYMDKQEQSILQNLIDILFHTKTHLDGGRHMVDKHGRRHQIHIGKRKGLYRTTRTGHKQYIRQKGGMTAEAVEEALPRIIPMLNELFFTPLRNARPMDFTGVRVLFDTLNEWGHGMNNWLILMFEFEHHVQMSYISMELVVSASAAHSQSPFYEQAAMQSFARLRTQAAELIQRMAVAVLDQFEIATAPRVEVWAR